MPFLKAYVSFPSNFASIFSAIKDNLTPLCFFTSNILYFGLKQPIKVQITDIFFYQNSDYSVQTNNLSLTKINQNNMIKMS